MFKKEKISIYVRLLVWATGRMDVPFSEIGMISERTGWVVFGGTTMFIIC